MIRSKFREWSESTVFGLKMDSSGVAGFWQILDFDVDFDGESVRISIGMPGDEFFMILEHPGLVFCPETLPNPT